MPTDRHDDGVAAEGTPVGDPHRVRVDEAGRSGLLDQLDPLATHHLGQSPLLMRVLGDPVGIGQGGGDVHLGGITPQAELPPGAGVTDQPGRPGQGPDRGRPLVQAGPAHPLGLDQGHLGAKLTGLQRRRGPGRPAAKHQQSHHRPTVGRWAPVDITRTG
jgi:hypothetical protein